MPEIEIATALHGIFSPRRVYDAGCGIGSYLEGFASLGCEIAGCELHWDIAGEFAAEPVRGVVRSHDLATPLREPIHSDLTLSIEVAEHIDAAHASVVARNICGVSSRHIVMTAAEPGQRGHGHINCQPREYWIRAMTVSGARYSHGLTRLVADRLRGVNRLGADLSRRVSVYRRCWSLSAAC